MNICPDYHIHTSFSDGNNRYKEYIEEALKRGIQEIGFSDHICVNPIDWRVTPENYQALTNQLSEICKKKTP